MSVEVIDDGITITSTAVSTELHQLLEAENIRPLLGKTITISCLLVDGTLYTDTFTMPETMPSASSVLSNFTELDSNGDWQMSLSVNAEGLLNFRIRTNTTISSASLSIDIRAVKLEVGSVSTLAMDTAPNYATELLKCQRYYHIYATESLRPSNMYDCVPVMASTPSQGTITIDSTTYYYNSADL